MNNPTILLDVARIKQREVLKEAAADAVAKRAQMTSTRPLRRWLTLGSLSGLRVTVAQVIRETAVKTILALVAAPQQ